MIFQRILNNSISILQTSFHLMEMELMTPGRQLPLKDTLTMKFGSTLELVYSSLINVIIKIIGMERKMETRCQREAIII